MYLHERAPGYVTSRSLFAPASATRTATASSSPTLKPWVAWGTTESPNGYMTLFLICAVALVGVVVAVTFCCGTVRKTSQNSTATNIPLRPTSHTARTASYHALHHAAPSSMPGTAYSECNRPKTPPQATKPLWTTRTSDSTSSTYLNQSYTYQNSYDSHSLAAEPSNRPGTSVSPRAPLENSIMQPESAAAPEGRAPATQRPRPVTPPPLYALDEELEAPPRYEREAPADWR